MFQLAAFTDEISQDFEHAVAVCGEYGVPAVEIRSAWQRKGPQDLLDDELTRMLDILGAARMTTACIASPFLKCDLGDAEAYQAHLGILRRCCEVARAMGTDIIRGFTFWRVPDLADAQYRQILAQFEEPCHGKPEDHASRCHRCRPDGRRNCRGVRARLGGRPGLRVHPRIGRGRPFPRDAVTRSRCVQRQIDRA